jgi:hypothetical protein
VVKRRKPAESSVTRIGPAQNQLVGYRFLEWTGIYGDVIEVTYDGLKPTGIMHNAMREDPKAQQVRSIN